MTDDDKQPPSVGCKVEQPSCRRCDTMLGNFNMAYGANVNPGRLVDIKFHEASFVPAPKCDTCEAEMEPVSGFEWACPNEGCDKHGEAIHVGIYPIRESP